MNKVWGVMTFTTSGFLPKINKPKGFKHPKCAVYAVNHTSYLDIPLLFLTVPGYFSIVGKEALAKVPIFGIMFRKVYITVNRNNRKSRYQTYLDAFNVIDQKRSLVLFPEGTIPDNPPVMIPFKEGPFKIAIEKQVPLIPVTIPYNWIILHDPTKLNGKWHKVEITFHEPIDTTGMTEKDIPLLKEKAFDIITQELKIKNKEKNGN